MIREVYRDNFEKLSKTCSDNLCDTFGGYCEYCIDENKFIEFWDGKKFIGTVVGNEIKKTIYLDFLLVNEKYRNKGYGKYIVKKLTEKYNDIYAEVCEESMNFYKKLGFHKCINQENKYFYNTIIMHLSSKKIKY